MAHNPNNEEAVRLYGLLLIGMGDFARQIVTGLIMVVAVVIDTYRAKISIQTES